MPWMRRNAPRLRRGALLIRGPCESIARWVPALRRTAKRRGTASGTRGPTIADFEAVEHLLARLRSLC